MALEALAGEKTIHEIAAKHQVHPNQVTQWRRQLVDQAAEVFGKSSGRTQADDQEKKPQHLDLAKHPPLACSLCFSDHGLRLDAEKFEPDYPAGMPCPNCHAVGGKMLPKKAVGALAHRFFVWGSMRRTDYGGAPQIQFNDKRTTSIPVSPWLKADVALFERLLGIGFFRYSPRLWMIGWITPLKDLQDLEKRRSVIARIIREYPCVNYGSDRIFYRVRLAPRVPSDPLQYDSPPDGSLCNGRVDSTGFPVLYASPDLATCLHECRVTAEDEAFVATMYPARKLRLLNLAVLLREDHPVTEFESLDMTVHMIFLAGKHAYKIVQEIARAARAARFDGLIFPSYFSLVRLGIMPFQTTYGISNRHLPSLQGHEESKTVPNLALFGRPVTSGDVKIRCINRIILNNVHYGYHFGPVTF